jgi:hypothetical protein
VKIGGMSKRSESALARWREVIQQQEASGLPVARFCQERGVPESSFFAWRRRLRRAATPPAFVEIKAAARDDCRVAQRDDDHAAQAGAARPEGSCPPIELLLPGDRRLLVHELAPASS